MTDNNALLTPTSLALSLSAPRSPPYGTYYHRLLTQGPHRTSSPEEESITDEAHSQHAHHNLIRRLHNQIFERYRKQGLPSHSLYRPHPHLSLGPEVGDRITRLLGVWLSLESQHHCRDSGNFRTICDTIVTLSAPSIALMQPALALGFWKLSQQCRNLRYGSHERQCIDIFQPSNSKQRSTPKKLIFFVHGGAWGSGAPWMYRLVATPFLEQGHAVAIVGYRTYPDGRVDEQVQDLKLAADMIAQEYPNDCQKVCICGHSSGAHIGLLFVVNSAMERMVATREAKAEDGFRVVDFCGLSGPYDISHHFDYEAQRGVEELSPMKPVNGYTRAEFQRNSPLLRLKDALAEFQEHADSLTDCFLPRCALLHGIEDATVPFTATAEAAYQLRTMGFTQCSEIYLADTSHQDTVMQLMTGGPTRDAVLRWLNLPSNEPSSTNTPRTLHAASKM